MQAQQATRDLAPKGKKTISSDLDGVLADPVSPFLPIVRKKLDIDMRYEEVTRYNVAYLLEKKGKKIPMERIHELWHELWSDPRNIPLSDPRVPEIINSLRQDFRVKVLTGSIVKESNIKEWLRINSIEYDEFEQLKDWHQKPMRAGCVHVDDQFTVSEEFAAKRKRMILMERPWNMGRNVKWEGHEHISVGKDWSHTKELLTAIA